MDNCILLCLCASLCLSCWATPPQTSSYGERGSDLGIRVFQQAVQSQSEENVVLSPHGVASVLGMLLPGAGGKTRHQLLTSLRYKKNGPYKMLKKLHKNLTSKSNQDILNIANGLFIRQGFDIEEQFMSTNKANYQAEIRSLDFSDTNGAAATINSWVNDRTQGKIPSLIKADMLDTAFTRLVVLNTIYFKGLWKSRFQPENTKMRNFYLADGTVSKVPMMSQLSVFNIGQATTPLGVTYKVIELPYHGNMSMLVVLPAEENVSISAVIPYVNTTVVQGWMKLLHLRKIRLLLPRFSAEQEVDLEAPLSALGMTDMFSKQKANFTHISTEPLYISKALQKAKIEVNEDGTKASAATTAILSARSSPPWVSVDRPFLFVIRHKLTGTVLFMGQINKP